jgi:anti-sigma-K factor RskA
MAEFAPQAQPSPQVWSALEQRLKLKPVSPLAQRWEYWRRLHDDLAFWRGLGMVSTTAALLLASVLLSRQAAQPQQPLQQAATYAFVATLSDDKAQPVALVTGDRQHGQMLVRILRVEKHGPDQSLELWAVAKDGKVKSLGLLSAQGTVTLPMPATMTAEAVPWLAVTLEPKGGSGNPEKPSGPVVCKGNWLSI